MALGISLLATGIALPTTFCCAPAAAATTVDELAEQWGDLRPRVVRFEVSGHDLASYIGQQREIVENVFGGIRADRSREGARFQVDADIQTVELSGLLESLAEELDLAARNAEFTRTVKEKTVNAATDCGATGDGVTDDGPALRAAIDKARQLGPGSRVWLPKGTYAIHRPVAGAMLALEEIRDLTIEAEEGTILLLKAVSTGIAVRGCRNVTLRNIGIDYDPLPFTQGDIVSVDAPGSAIEVRIHAGFPAPDQEYFRKARYLRGTMRDAETGDLHPDSQDPRITAITRTPAGTFRLVLADNALKPFSGPLGRYRAGHPFVIQARATPGGGPAWFLQDSEYVTLENTRTYASFVHIAVVSGCTGVKFRGCVAEPLPESGRLSCGNADGIHCPSNRKGPLLENCRFFRINDDDVNIYGKCLSVARQDSPTELTLEQKASSKAAGSAVATPLLKVGDAAALVSLLDGTVRGVARITATKVSQWHNRARIQLVLDRAIPGVVSRDDAGRGPSQGRQYVSQSGKLEAAEDVVVNLNAKGDGFVIRDCDFGHHRANGIKIQASDGIVEGNRVQDVPGVAIWLWSGYNWLEAYPPHNVVIRGNTLINRKGIAGSITVLGRARRPQRMIRRVTIEGNRLIGATQNGITFNSAEDVDIRHNEIRSPRPITLFNCADIRIGDNTFPDTVETPVKFGGPSDREP